MSYAATMGGRQQRFADYGFSNSGLDISGGSTDPTGGGAAVPGTDASSYGPGSANDSFFSSSSTSGADALGLPAGWDNVGAGNPYGPSSALGGAINGGAASSNTGSIIGGIGAGIGSIIGAFTGRGGSSAPAPGASGAAYSAPAASSSLLGGTTGVLLGLGALAALVFFSHRQPRAAAPPAP